MVGLRHFLLLVLVEFYLYLWTSYHQHFLKVNLHHEQTLLKGDRLQLSDFFLCYLFYSFGTFMISKRLGSYFYCFFVVLNFLVFCKVGWFSSARAFYVIMKWSLKVLESSFSSVSILSFSANISSIYFKKTFANKKWFN